ncbi:WbqC family protein [bacterium]|jgi:hypothetical protein|nr:WbqC family protein [bacterium]
MRKNSPIILTAHQPVYLPWLGLFHKIALADVFCLFDIVQYQRKDFNNRNKIKTSVDSIWLTVPVKSSGRLNSIITDIEIINDGWHKKHLKSIELNYKKTPYFDQYYYDLKKILDTSYQYLVDLNFDILVYLLNALNIDTKTVKASDYLFKGAKSELVLDMCIQLNADIYIFGENGKNYANIDTFTSSGVDPYFQAYNHPVYNQAKGRFMPYMSVLDLLFNEGQNSNNIIMSDNISKKDILILNKDL